MLCPESQFHGDQYYINIDFRDECWDFSPCFVRHSLRQWTYFLAMAFDLCAEPRFCCIGSDLDQRWFQAPTMSGLSEWTR